MDLRQLRNLIAVIEMGSLGKAAEALHISQPALTKSIHRLEERLGVPLFYRDSRGMRPTVYGNAFRLHAQAVSIGVDQAMLELEAMKSGSIGVVSVAAPPLITNQILSKATLILMRDRPGLRMNITTEIGDATADLLAGKYDFILTLLTRSEPEPGLQQRLLFNDHVAMIVRANHPLLRRKTIRARDLEAYRWVLPLPGHFHRRKLESFFENEGVPPPRPVLECSSVGLILSVVQATDHIGMIAGMGLQEESARTGNIVEIPSDSPFMSRPVGLVWRENHVLSKSSKLLIEAIETVCSERTLLAAAPETRGATTHRAPQPRRRK